MPSGVATAAIAASLRRIYGDLISVHHHMVDDEEVRQTFASALEFINAEHLPLPVTIFDHEILFVGGIEPLKVVAAVAEKMRLEAGG